MKKELLILCVVSMALPGWTQETNELVNPSEIDRPKPAENNRKRPERTEQQRKELQERRYQFMEKALNDIGVSDEDKIKIRKLQETHRQKMKENMERGIAARKTLSELQEKGATEEELDRAIEAVVGTMEEQLKILVRNRMAMEKILGKEKYTLFMQNARKQFHKHGRSGGSGMPPRPGLPPIPGEGKGSKQPPMPPKQPPPPPAT